MNVYCFHVAFLFFSLFFISLKGKNPHRAACWKDGLGAATGPIRMQMSSSWRRSTWPHGVRDSTTVVHQGSWSTPGPQKQTLTPGGNHQHSAPIHIFPLAKLSCPGCPNAAHLWT
ncbi:unnamed protein product [Boreogadus saida]